MRQIRVHGTFTPDGFSLSRMAIVNNGNITDETRNTVYNVLRMYGRHNFPNVLIFDVGNWDEQLWG